MAPLSISDTARVAGVSRVTLPRDSKGCSQLDFLHV